MRQVLKVVLTHTTLGQTLVTPSAAPAFEKRGWTRVSEPAVAVSGLDDTFTPAGRPPEHGAGSGRDAWVAYAHTLGIDVTSDATRNGIIAAVDALD